MVADRQPAVNTPARQNLQKVMAGCFRSRSSKQEGMTMDMRARMRYYGVSQEALADRCGVTRCYIGLIVAGKRRLTERIAAALDDLCREAAAQRVADAEERVAALLAEDAAGGGDGGD